LHGSGTAQYRNRHYYEAYQVIADDLVLSMESPRQLTRGETAGTLAALICPGQSHADTAEADFVTLEEGDSVALLVEDMLTAVHFSTNALTDARTGALDVCFHLAAADSVPVFEGVTTKIDNDGAALHPRLLPGQPILARSITRAIVNGACRLEGTTHGVYATALAHECHVSVLGSKRQLAQGETAFFEAELSEAGQ